jgi:hypothetical protein
VHFDTALNLVWLFLGSIALGCTTRAAIRGSKSPWLHVIGVALIVAALFPYISATDDLVRSEPLSTQPHKDHPFSGKKPSNNNLIRLYETLDSPLACATCVLTLTFFAVWMILLPALGWDRGVAPAFAGRSPPLPLGL